MELKVLGQDIDVVLLANKDIVIWCFVGREYDLQNCHGDKKALGEHQGHEKWVRISFWQNVFKISV